MVTKPLTPKQAAKQLVTTREAIQTFEAALAEFDVGNKIKLTHRIAYERYVGEIPPGLCVCHRCDTPACVNPKHLFVGTIADNARDRDAKGRTVCGEAYWNTKLTLADVERLRALRSSGALFRELAQEFGISLRHAQNIIAGRKWRASCG